MQVDLVQGLKAEIQTEIAKHRQMADSDGQLLAYETALRKAVSRYRDSKSADAETMSTIQQLVDSAIARARSAGKVEFAN